MLVAANLCAVLAREWRAGEEPLREDLELFASLLGEPPARSAGARPSSTPPCGMPRGAGRAPPRGAMDDRLDEIAVALREHVRRKLAIARPGYDG